MLPLFAVVLAQRTDRSLALEQPSKVGADVGGAVPVPVQWHEIAVPLCATPQSANLPPHLRLLLLPRPARAEAPAACLRGVRLRRRCHHEPSRELAHQADADARRVASIARRACPAGDESPRVVSEDERARIALLFDPFQTLDQSLLRLLRLDCRLPPPFPVTEVSVERQAGIHRVVTHPAAGTERLEVGGARMEPWYVVAQLAVGAAMALSGESERFFASGALDVAFTIVTAFRHAPSRRLKPASTSVPLGQDIWHIQAGQCTRPRWPDVGCHSCAFYKKCSKF